MKGEICDIKKSSVIADKFCSINMDIKQILNAERLTQSPTSPVIPTCCLDVEEAATLFSDEYAAVAEVVAAVDEILLSAEDRRVADELLYASDDGIRNRIKDPSKMQIRPCFPGKWMHIIMHLFLLR